MRGCPRKALTMRRGNPDGGDGLRWMAESAFSWMKRAFGEYVTAKKFENVVGEMTMNFLYNLPIGMARTA